MKILKMLKSKSTIYPNSKATITAEIELDTEEETEVSFSISRQYELDDLKEYHIETINKSGKVSIELEYDGNAFLYKGEPVLIIHYRTDLFSGALINVNFHVKNKKERISDYSIFNLGHKREIDHSGGGKLTKDKESIEGQTIREGDKLNIYGSASLRPDGECDVQTVMRFNSSSKNWRIAYAPTRYESGTKWSYNRAASINLKVKNGRIYVTSSSKDYLASDRLKDGENIFYLYIQPISLRDPAKNSRNDDRIFKEPIAIKFYYEEKDMPKLTINSPLKYENIFKGEYLQITGNVYDSIADPLELLYEVNGKKFEYGKNLVNHNFKININVDDLNPGKNIIKLNMNDGYFYVTKEIILTMNEKSKGSKRGVIKYNLNFPKNKNNGFVTFVERNSDEVEVELSSLINNKNYQKISRVYSKQISEELYEDCFYCEYTEKAKEATLSVALSKKDHESKGGITKVSGSFF